MCSQGSTITSVQETPRLRDLTLEDTSYCYTVILKTPYDHKRLYDESWGNSRVRDKRTL